VTPVVALVLVGVGGAVGAVLRTALTRLVASEWFPVGTLAVNVLGSLALGFVAGLAPGERLTLLLGEGVCGAFTTFSSFSTATVRLADDHPRRAALNVVLTLALGLSAAAAGYVLTTV